MAEPSTDATTIRFSTQFVMQIVGIAVTIVVTVNASTWELKSNQREMAVQVAAQSREMAAKMEAREAFWQEAFRQQNLRLEELSKESRYSQAQITEMNLFLAESGLKKGRK